MRDSYRERSQRAVMGRRGCRATTDIGSRFEILAYVVWHADCDLIEGSIEIAEGLRPGTVASWMARSFEREFRRERSMHADRSCCDLDRDVGDVHIAHDEHCSEVHYAVHLDRSVRSDSWELSPPHGITWAYVGRRKTS